MELNDAVQITAEDRVLGRRQKSFKGRDGIVKAIGLKTVCVEFPGGKLVHIDKNFVA